MALRMVNEPTWKMSSGPSGPSSGHAWRRFRGGLTNFCLSSLRARCLPWDRRCRSRDLKSHTELLGWAPSLQSPRQGLGLATRSRTPASRPKVWGHHGPEFPRGTPGSCYCTGPITAGGPRVAPSDLDPRAPQTVLGSGTDSLSPLPVTCANVQAPSLGTNPSVIRGGKAK